MGNHETVVGTNQMAVLHGNGTFGRMDRAAGNYVLTTAPDGSSVVVTPDGTVNYASNGMPPVPSMYGVAGPEH